MTLSTCQVRFHGLRHSSALEGLIHERANWLQHFTPAALAVRALIDAPHHHSHEQPIRVQLRVFVPDDEPITVECEGITDAYALVRDAFDIARRQLQDAVREQRGFMKTHANATRRVV